MTSTHHQELCPAIKLGIVIYQLLLQFIDYRLSNLIAIISAKIFAYFVNKKFVFHSKCANVRELFLEILRFTLTRGFTGLVDYFGLILLVEGFQFSQSISKYAIQAVVIILNYIFGKKTVFVTAVKRKTEETNQK